MVLIGPTFHVTGVIQLLVYIQLQWLENIHVIRMLTTVQDI